MNKDKLTTIAGVTAAVCAALLGTGLLVVGTPIFMGVSAVGAVSVGLIGFFAKDKDEPKILP